MTNLETLAQTVADEYAALPSVLAVVQSGSVTAGNADEQSDIDLYVYSRQDVPLEARREIAMRRGRHIEVNNNFAENGDEWIERGSGVAIDVMFRFAASFEDHLTYLLEKYEARQGYSTAVWHNLRTSRILFDREGWFAALQQRANVPYPNGLAQAIIALNVPLLRGIISIHARYRSSGPQDVAISCPSAWPSPACWTVTLTCCSPWAGHRTPARSGSSNWPPSCR